MNCHLIKTKARLYLEDLLPEDIRLEFRGHLSSCGDCEHYFLLLGTLAVDLKLLAELAPPEDFSSDFPLLNTLPENENKEPVPPLSKVFLWGGVAAMLFAGILLVYPSLTKRNAAEKQMTAPALTEPVKLDGMPQPGSPAAEKNAEPPPLKIDMKPLHWDLSLTDREIRIRFREILGRSQFKVLFESPSFLVLSLDHNAIERLTSMMGDLKIRLYNGVPIRKVSIPDFSGDIRLSLFMEAPESRAAKSLLNHWHLKFELPNRLVLKESLQEKGVRFIYDAPEIWVIEVNGSRLESVLDKIHEFHGVSLDLRWFEHFDTATYHDVPVQVAIYLDE